MITYLILDSKLKNIQEMINRFEWHNLVPSLGKDSRMQVLSWTGGNKLAYYFWQAIWLNVLKVFKMFILFDSLSQRLGISPEEIIRDI